MADNILNINDGSYLASTLSMAQPPSLAFQQQGKTLFRLENDGTVWVDPEYRERMDELTNLFFESVARTYPRFVDGILERGGKA